MKFGGKVFLWYGMILITILSLAVVVASRTFQHSLYEGNSLTHAFWLSSAILILAALVIGFGGGFYLMRRYTATLKRLKNVTNTASQQQLSRAFPHATFKDRDPVESIGRELYDFMKQRHETLQQVLHFSSLASHELRTPLTIIRNQLEDGLRADSTFEHLRTVLTSTYDEIIRLHHLVNDLLTISTMQAGTLRLEKSQIEFPQFMKDFYDEALLLSRERNISVVLAKGPTVTISGDKMRLRQMLFNLLDNAIKFTPEHGRIYLSYDICDDEIVIKIADTGYGIPQQYIKRIFEPFYQIARYDQENRPGAGLGLSLVRWIVEAHKGSVRVESEEGKGTTFRISLPR